MLMPRYMSVSVTLLSGEVSNVIGYSMPPKASLCWSNVQIEQTLVGR